MAKIVVTLGDAVAVNMQTTDTLQFVFQQAGLICSTDGGDFNPTLPHGHHFAAGHTWPKPADYPNGASPRGDCDATYGFEPGGGGECDPIKGIVMQPIHVGSGPE